MGKGTTFTIKLPIDKSKQIKEYKILIIDDDEDIIKIFTEMINEYEKQADDFLVKHKIGFKAVFKDDKRPLWCDGGCMHGKRHLVTFKRNGGRFSLSFWNSFNDAMKGKEVTAYDVLASVQKYDIGSFAEFCGSFGYDVLSRKSLKIYKLVVKEWEKISNFFTSEELEELQEIN